jgi:tetratricopeptide (TPR) repeat protein
MMKNEFEQTQAFRKGVRLFQRHQYTDALQMFRKAVATDDITVLRDSDPLYLSYYGVSLSLVKSKYALAEKLCRIAMKKGQDFPEVYLNLARVYEENGKRNKASEIYRMGYRRHPGKVDFLKHLQRLSPRGKVIVPFLDRDHFINKYAGLVFRRGLKKAHN